MSQKAASPRRKFIHRFSNFSIFSLRFRTKNVHSAPAFPIDMNEFWFITLYVCNLITCTHDCYEFFSLCSASLPTIYLIFFTSFSRCIVTSIVGLIFM
jgi:hypothetical protein